MLDSNEDDMLKQQFACLNLVSNAVLIYNTVHITRIIEELRQEGMTILDEDIARIWPSRFAHINFIGRYYFAVEDINPKPL